ncbi:hypothetical protein ElyMa_003314900 [Elysia marginata]|uniref:Uncharacterized protein n=1 Tax=Elysia marginata TaxID=1093978 RepID=A0AAV4JDT1_9GAST|nr:hypothetical protein ElyMa_003314900 [Elysia marginata]
MVDGLTGPVSQSCAVKPTLTTRVITSYVIVVGAQGLYYSQFYNRLCHATLPAHGASQPAGTRQCIHVCLLWQRRSLTPELSLFDSTPRGGSLIRDPHCSFFCVVLIDKIIAETNLKEAKN